MSCWRTRRCQHTVERYIIGWSCIAIDIAFLSSLFHLWHHHLWYVSIQFSWFRSTCLESQWSIRSMVLDTSSTHKTKSTSNKRSPERIGLQLVFVTLKIHFKAWRSMKTLNLLPFKYVCSKRTAIATAKRSRYVVGQFCAFVLGPSVNSWVVFSFHFLRLGLSSRQTLFAYQRYWR